MRKLGISLGSLLVSAAIGHVLGGFDAKAQGQLGIATTAFPADRFGIPFTKQLVGVGGTPPYVFSIASGNLPPGVTLSPSGLLGGTPGATGFFPFQVRIQDSTQNTATAGITLALSPPFSDEPLPGGTVGRAYTASILRPQLVLSYPVTFLQGILPPGLQLNSNGTISGTPTAGGTYQFLARSVSNPQEYGVWVISIAGPLTFQSFPLADAIVGKPYQSIFNMFMLGGTPPYRFSVTQGALPPGLTLSDTGQFTGSPSQAGVFNFQVTLEDKNNLSGSASFSIRVLASAPAVACAALPMAYVSRFYSYQLALIGGTPPARFTQESTVPGLRLSFEGLLSGVPTQSGNFNFAVRVFDAGQVVTVAQCGLLVKQADFRISDTALPTGRVGEGYTYALQTTDGVAPVRFALESGALPQGITLAANGALSGAPSRAGEYRFTIRATDGSNLSAAASFVVTIAPPRLSLDSLTLPSGLSGQTYSHALGASGGAAPYRFAVIQGALPSGLELASGTGSITGVPTQSGTATFTVRVSDSASQTAERSYALTIAEALTLTAAGLPPATVYLPYSFPLTARGGGAPYRFTLASGTLPPGLELDATGRLIGVPLSAGPFRFITTVLDASNSRAQLEVSMVIALPAELPAAMVGREYVASLGRGAFQVNPAGIGGLPAGLSLASDGTLTGRALVAGFYSFVVGMQSANSLPSNLGFTLAVSGDGFQIESAALPGTRVGNLYEQNLRSRGGTPPYQWRIGGGTIPAGLVLDTASGTIRGRTTLPGNSFFTVEVRDAQNRIASRRFSLSAVTVEGPVIAAAVSAADYSAAGVAPGELLTIFGETLGATTLTTFAVSNGSIATALAGTRVLFDQSPAPIIYTVSGQVSVIAPFSLQGRSITRMTVERQGVPSLPLTLEVVAAKPAIFTVDGSGSGPGAILNQDGSVNTEANAAPKETVIVFYATGGGTMLPQGVEGRIAGGTSELRLPATAEIGGLAARVLYSGNAPGLLEGVIQVNVQLPAGLPTGKSSLNLEVGGIKSAGEVTVWVR